MSEHKMFLFSRVRSGRRVVQWRGRRHEPRHPRLPQQLQLSETLPVPSRWASLRAGSRGRAWTSSPASSWPLSSCQISPWTSSLRFGQKYNHVFLEMQKAFNVNLNFIFHPPLKKKVIFFFIFLEDLSNLRFSFNHLFPLISPFSPISYAPPRAFGGH